MLHRLVVFLLCYLAIIPSFLRRQKTVTSPDELVASRLVTAHRLRRLTGHGGLLRSASYLAVPALGILALAPVLVHTGAPETGTAAPNVIVSPTEGAAGRRGDGTSTRGGERTADAAVSPPSEPTAAITPPEASVTAPNPAAPEVASPAPTEVSPREALSHTVRPGDTVNKLAAQYGLQSDTIVRANGLSNPNRILPGQLLFIPADDSYVPPAPTARPVPAVQPGMSRQTAFIAKIASGAQESQRVTGVPASVTIAQAILETAWGTSYLAREANNYFGIKAHARPGPAGVVWIDAWEVENGKDVVRPEPFRKYNTVAESLVEHGWFFLENPRYRLAMQATSDPREFARRINAAGYATDPAYAAKLISFMDRYNLYRYDLQ